MWRARRLRRQKPPERAELVLDTVSETADALARYLTTASLIENVDYPISAKDFQRRLGNFSSATARVREAGPFLRSQLHDVVDQMVALGEDVAKTLGIKGKAA